MANSSWQLKNIFAGVALVAGAALIAAPVVAQEKKAAPAAAKKAPAAAKKAPAAAKKAAGKTKKSLWVKVCEKTSVPDKEKKDKDGKPVKIDKNLCSTHHARLDSNTGLVLFSFAIMELEGAEKKLLSIKLPLGMALPVGVHAVIYNKDQWAKASKKEKVDEKKLKSFKVQYTLCHPTGCLAEGPASKEILDQVTTGGGLVVLAVNASGERIGFRVPLEGFNEALAGAPIDNEAYKKARAAVMKQIQNRRNAALKEFKKEQGVKDGAPAKKAPAKKQ